LGFGLDLLFPPRCAGCGRVDSIWCAACAQEVDRLPFPAVRSLSTSASLQAVAVTGLHEGRLQKGLWALKYENIRQVAVPLGQRLAARLADTSWTIDTLVPVPLHIDRQQQRGYNQAALLASAVSEVTGIPMLSQALERQIDTRSQVGLNAEERQANVQDAFRARPDLIAHQTILLIDDVYTTGATLEACAQAALEAGASAVYGLTVTAARG
jgi:ComF family protein